MTRTGAEYPGQILQRAFLVLNSQSVVINYRIRLKHKNERLNAGFELIELCLNNNIFMRVFNSILFSA